MLPEEPKTESARIHGDIRGSRIPNDADRHAEMSRTKLYQSMFAVETNRSSVPRNLRMRGSAPHPAVPTLENLPIHVGQPNGSSGVGEKFDRQTGAD